MMMKQNDYGVPLTHDTQRWVSLMTILGALTGQIMFGVLGDQFGRKWTFISTAVLTVLGTILQAAAQPRMMGLNIWQQVSTMGFAAPDHVTTRMHPSHRPPISYTTRS